MTGLTLYLPVKGPRARGDPLGQGVPNLERTPTTRD